MTDTSAQGGGHLLDRLNRWYSRLEDLLAGIAALSIFGLMLFGVVQIVLRSIFNAPIWGYIDVVEQLMALFAFLAVAYCQRLGGHVRMDLIISRFRGRLYWIVEFLAVLVGLVFIAIMIPPSYEHFVRAYELGDSTIDAGIPIWPSKLAVPFALSLLWLRLLLQVIGYGRLALMPKAEPIAVPTVLAVEELAAEEIREALGDDAGKPEGAPR
ncbi:MAG: TRAP transporter small permease [Minwuiales bacterium]|nr:TRAP transporter small permease [Minwuiales bacterium]